MEVILLERIRNLGNLGDQVKVKPGYGRNFLIPQKLAVPATKANIAEFESRRAELQAKAEAVFEAAKKRAETMQDVKVTIAAQASEEGKLYGSVATNEIETAMSEAGHKIERREVLLPDGPIHSLGEFTVGIQLHSDVTVDITVEVVAA